MEDDKLIPDRPQPFGYKCSWLALQTQDMDAVIQALDLADVRPVSWKHGIEAGYQGLVFVSPPIQGWILVVSRNLPYPGDSRHPDRCTPFLKQLGHQFPDIQFFATHRVSSYVAWARVMDGDIIRQYAYADGETGWNYGDETAEEIKLGLRFPDFNTLAYDDLSESEVEALKTPDEEDVMNLAGAWSIDPTRLDEVAAEPGVGYIGRFQKERRRAEHALAADAMRRSILRKLRQWLSRS